MSCLSSSFLALSDKPDRIVLKFGGPIHYGPLQAQLTFGNASQNSRRFPAFDWLDCFSALPDKLIGFSLCLVGKLNMSLLRPGQLMVMLHYIPAVSWSQILTVLYTFRLIVHPTELKFGEQDKLPPLAGLTFVYALLNCCHYLASDGSKYSAHLQIHHWLDWVEIWWTYKFILLSMMATWRLTK